MVTDTSTNDILLSVFRKRDADGSGTIGASDLTDLLQHIGVPAAHIPIVLKNVGTTSSGNVNYEELVTWLQTDSQPGPLKKKVQVGAPVPNINLHKNFGPPEMVPLADFCKGKKVVLVGLPGAFTPTCSSRQIPGYLAKQDQLKAKGVSDVLVFCVNDGAVMQAWGKAQGTEGSFITLLGDPASELTKALGLELVAPGPMSVLGYPRVKRFSALIDDGIVKTLNVCEDPSDPAGDNYPEQTLVDKMLSDLQGA